MLIFIRAAMGDLYYILLYLISATHYHYQSAANSAIASAEKRWFLALFISGDNLQGADIKFIMTMTHWTITSIIRTNSNLFDFGLSCGL